MLGEHRGVLGLSHVGGDHDGVLEPVGAQPLAEHGHRGELIGRHGEESLDLWRVQVDGEHAIRPRGGDEVGHEAGGDGDARLVLLVAARVRKVGQDRRHPARGGMRERVEQDQQLDDVLRQRGRRRLHHEHVLLADVLLDPDLEVLVREARGGKPAGRDAETLADRLGQRGVRRSGEDLEPVHLSGPYCSRLMDGSSGAPGA